jgi:DNA-binding IclR family transcriptional regulator
MARSAPGTERTVAILNFLASHPRDRFSLSELCRQTGLSKATAHAQVTALSDAGYLLRHSADKTYSLGPALIAIGTAAAAAQYDVVDVAREQMQRLSDELGVQTVASAVLGEEMILLARTGKPEPMGVSVQIGARVPLVPPLGTAFLAWAPAAEVETWLRRLGPEASDGELERYRLALDTVRRRGYTIGLDADARVRLGRAIEEHGDPRGAIEDLGHAEYILTELESAPAYRLSLMAAPVFGSDGRVALTLTLFGFRQPLRADEVPRYAKRLLEATANVTRAIAGREPDLVTTDDRRQTA